MYFYNYVLSLLMLETIVLWFQWQLLTVVQSYAAQGICEMFYDVSLVCYNLQEWQMDAHVYG